jgi:eukaryotic-like serine/threonine-protein kinase
MNLSAGQRLGPYEIVGPLGAGGMGEVFTARDTRLSRLVAVKVLPRELAADHDRRARFEREARAIAALSHPHVCALFDVGRAEGPDGEIEYLVMERLEGETLASRLARGPMPAAEVVALGGQLAGALAAAHRQGIVHRDLKPGNVMLTRAGAKLLDFGLARRDESAPLTSDGEESHGARATESRPLTAVGMLVGTWPYLAPEQVRGRPADARSDLFAFGAVLHEALTGQRAFPGATAPAITAAILGTEPKDVREAAPDTPPALAALVRQCLAKDPDDRWQRADDVARGLQLLEEATGRAGAGSRPAALVSWWAIGIGVLGLAAAVAALLLARRPRTVEPLSFAVTPPPGLLVARLTMDTPFAVSPDGRRIVFMAGAGGVSSLWLWSAEDGQTRRLEDTAGGISPFFSPDGREIAFFAGDDLRRVPIDGGPATTIAATPLGSSGTWGSKGDILFTRTFGPEAGLWSVPARGGEARPLVPAPTFRELRAFPRFLPDGRRYLFLKGRGVPPAGRRLCVASLDGGEPDCFASCQSQGEYSGSGHVLCVRAGTLVAMPFDARRGRVTGEAATVARELRWFGPSGAANLAVSADGSTLVHERQPGSSRLAWLDRGGREVATVGEAGPFGLLQLAPDGRLVVVDVLSQDTGGRDLWTLDTASGVRNRLTFPSIDASAPTWSPEGRRLAFARTDEGSPDVTLLHLDGSRREEVLLRAPGVQLPKHWSPDGRLIAYEDYTPGRRDQRQLWLLSLDGKTRRVTSTPSSSYQGRFSSDGRRLAYVSEESGRPEVYVVGAEGGLPRRISRAGGLLPRWRGDSAELFFFQPDGMMMAVPAADPDAVPRSLFHLEGVIARDFDYDVARDGQRFLVLLPPEGAGVGSLHVALEWTRRLGKAETEGR